MPNQRQPFGVRYCSVGLCVLHIGNVGTTAIKLWENVPFKTNLHDCFAACWLIATSIIPQLPEPKKEIDIFKGVVPTNH